MSAYILTERHETSKINNALDVFENPRILHHLLLSNICNFVPSIVFPDEEMLALAREKNGLPIQEIEGIQLSAACDHLHLTVLDYVNIAFSVLDQVRFLLNVYGLLLLDRNLSNLFLVPAERSSLHIGGAYWQVKHIDLREVMDVSSEPIFQRVGNIKIPSDIHFVGEYHEMLATFKSEMDARIRMVSYKEKDSGNRKKVFDFYTQKMNVANRKKFVFSFYTVESVYEEFQELFDVLSR